MVLGSAIGPLVTGALIDAGLEIDRQMLLIGLYFLVTAGIVTLSMRRARPHLPPAREIDVIGA